ncbi:DUF3800 domain-containing protein [Patescibacteria group bacterium]|nr:MAG: DUF3800 domain-containing protein [Patescibacteria group bacterium]
MLVFIDEAGDTGRKTESGSSRYFIISLVIFDDNEDALSCDQRINLLRKELDLPSDFEFHFSFNSDKIKERFLSAIQPYRFIYFAVVIDKDPNKLWGPGFITKESFYKYACQMVFNNALPHLNNATVILDKSGSPDFRSRLAKYLRVRLNTNGKKVIKKLKQQRSKSNNLLQVADYITGVVSRKVQNKKDWTNYYKYVADKEIWVQRWPK